MKELIDGIIGGVAVAGHGESYVEIGYSMNGGYTARSVVRGDPNPFATGVLSTPEEALRALASQIADALEKKGLDLRARGNLHAEVVAQLRNVADASRGAQ